MSLHPLLPRDTQGVTGKLPYNPVDYCILAGASAIAWAFAIELDIAAFLTFRHRRGLYFWSLLISSWGCALHALGFTLKFLVGASWLVTLPFINIGWVAMVTGQAFVLYSRLNMVVRNQRLMRFVRTMIIIDALCFHIPIIIFIYGANSPDHDAWAGRFNVMERIQLLGFSVQETAISSVYIVATIRLLSLVYQMRTRKAMIQLLAINFICIGMDMVLIGLEFSNHYVGEASVKPLIYAIKLKLEFAVYKQLIGFTKAAFTSGNTDPNDPKDENCSASSVPIDPIPKRKLLALRKPSIPNEPTIMTHPEQMLGTQQKKPIDINKEWDSSNVDLNPNAIAAKLTASKPGETTVAAPPPAARKRSSGIRSVTSGGLRGSQEGEGSDTVTLVASQSPSGEGIRM